MRFSKYFSLPDGQDKLDFVDIEVGKDRPLFLNPRLIVETGDAMSKDCEICIQSFFQTLLDSIRLGNTLESDRILSHTNEINEIHFGYSKEKSRGSGFGRDTKKLLISSLSNSSAIQISGLIEDIEDLYLFVDGVGQDRLTDMVGNVIRSELAAFTVEQCHKYGIKTEADVTLGYFWNPNTKEWIKSRGEGLMIGESLYLLVPSSFASRDCSFDSGSFINNSLYGKTTFHQMLIEFAPLFKDTERDKDGKIIITESLIKAFMDQNSITSNKQIAGLIAQKNQKALSDFRNKPIEQSVKESAIEDAKNENNSSK